MIFLRFQGKPFNITVIQVYAPITNAEYVEVEQFYNDLQDLLELTPKKKSPFHHRVLECKSRKSRDTWSNRKVWIWSAKWSRAKANRVLSRDHTGHSKHPLPKIKRQLYTWTSPMVNSEIRLLIIFAAEAWKTLCSQQKQDLELTMELLLQNSGLNWRK